MTGHPDLAGINIYNNVICNNVKGGFAAFDYNGFYRTFSLINNTFYNNGDIREIVLDGSSSAYNDCIVSNNIIVNNYKSAYLIRFRNYDGADVLINNNLFYDISGYQKDNVYGLDYILDQDPLFTDPENGDFTLQKKSPAIDAGLAVDTIATDYAGNARPEDTGIDIGAYEYVKTNSSPVNHVKIKPSTARATASLIGSEADGIMNMMSLDELTDDYTADISSHIVPVTGQTSYVAEAYDSENNLVSGLDFRWSVNNPEAGSIDANGLFTAGTETGYFEDLIQATTDDGVTGTASVTIIESPFAPIEDQLVDEGQSILFTVSANVEDGLVYSAYNLPDGAAFDEIIQLFSWTPSYEQAGYYDDIQFQATDGTYIVTGTVNITVNDINRAPILDSIGDRMVDEGTTLSFNVSGSDPDGDNLTYTSHYLPEDAVFDESAGEFTWTPSTEQTGNYFGIIFQVSDGRLTDEEEIAITVNKVNHSPVIDAVGNKIVETGDTLAFTVTGSDPDGDDLTYSASNLPDGAEFNPATRVFSWTPGQSQAGRYTNIRLGVTDGELSDLTTTTITVMGKTVDLNNAPVLDSIGDKSVGIRERLIFSISASDADGDRLTYSASNIPQRSIFSNSSGRFIFIPSSSQAGTYKITFTVTDGALTDSETITIWVTGPNKAPVMNAITPKTVEAGNTLMFKVQASDANGDVLTYSASNLPDGAEFDPSTRVFSWTPGQSQAGRYTNIRFGVTDGESSDLTTTTITVMGGSSNLDNAPVMDPIGDKSVGIGGRLTFSIAATDADGDRLTYNATDMPQRATLNKNSGGFVFTPSLSQIGTYEVTFTVTDGALTDSETITIRVTEPNKAPVMNTILPQTIEAGETLTFEVQASDANGDALTCWASGLPDGSEFDPATRIFSWSPSASQTGTSHVIRFYVTDGTATVYKIAYIRVR
ncbi:MAG: tandem-95 repeat protein [Dehalococcoidales bacterium]|nr:tandem-95 repeat protein [Dehalococcoidales bacterium]